MIFQNKLTDPLPLTVSLTVKRPFFTTHLLGRGKKNWEKAVRLLGGGGSYANTECKLFEERPQTHQTRQIPDVKCFWKNLTSTFVRQKVSDLGAPDEGSEGGHNQV